jgi:hypothetical protein
MLDFRATDNPEIRIRFSEFSVFLYRLHLSCRLMLLTAEDRRPVRCSAAPPKGSVDPE